jgi:hypothetical protein
MMVLKARVEIAEKDFAASIRTLETGFSFGQQVAEGPFLINGLVGIACASQIAEVLPDLIERPDAPNLYWALTVIPRPLIDIRKEFELEQRCVELQFPDLADIDRPRSAEQWDALLANVRSEMRRLVAVSEGSVKPKPPLAGTAPEDPAARSPDLLTAKKYLTERLGMKSAEVDAMPPARVLLVWIVCDSREIYDDLFKATYLPYAQARGVSDDAEKRLKSAPDTEAKRLGGALVPTVFRMMVAQTRLDRKIAALRVIEALRLYAAANNGKLPTRLDQITEVPAPDDPGTGKPFEYTSDGVTATVIGRLPGERLANAGIRYKLTIRK